MDQIAQELNQLDLGDISDDQAKGLQEFFSEKARIGEMKNEDFKKICELGAGNGGLVLQVLHKPSGIIMARKVSMTHFVYMFTCLIVYLFTCLLVYWRK